ncbi:condensation domain-containing protein, partial [Microbispora sp. NPDC004025]
MIPLSFAQRRLWFLHHLEGPSATYNLPLVLRLTGDLDRGALAAALNDVVGRHESLRTVFPDIDGVPHQHILDQAHVEPVTVEAAPDEVSGLVGEAVRRTFDLAVDLPIRAWLFAVSPAEHVLVVVVHHIAGDGWSLRPLASDLATAYAARRQGQAPAWEPLPVQYADYTMWQQDLLGDPDDPNSLQARQLAYWTTTLNGLPEQLPLPADRPRPPIATHRGHTTSFTIDPATHHGLNHL